MSDCKQVDLARKIGLRGVVLRGGAYRATTLMEELDDAIKDAVDRFGPYPSLWVRQHSMAGGEIEVYVKEQILDHYGSQVWPIIAWQCTWLEKVEVEGEDEPRMLRWATDKH